MNRIVFTGTASGFPSPDRACSSFVLQLGDKLYQFDAGEGFSNSVLRLKINFNQITQVFISHLHPDHITGIFLELQLMYLAGRRMPLEIYVPDEGVESLEKAARLFYLFKEKFPFVFHFVPIRPNPVFREKEFTLYAYHNRHLTPNQHIIEQTGAANLMQSYSYVVNLADKRILYSGDIKDETDLDGLFENIHTVITEGMHCDLEALADHCAEKKVKRLIVTHLKQNQYARPSALLKIAAQYRGMKIMMAYDGLKLTI